MARILTVHVAGLAELEAGLKKLEGGLDTRRILDQGAALIYNRMRSRFLLAVDPNDVPWPPSQAALRREASGRGGGTLFDVGKLFRSLQLYSVGDDSRAIGTDATNDYGFPYPLIHQFGLAGFPQRQFLGFGEGDIQLMSDVVIDHIVEVLSA